MTLASIRIADLLPLGLLAAIAAVLYILGYVFYNLLLHPLRRFPGPVLMRATRATYYYKSLTGVLPFEVLDLHKRYGDVVRIAPNEVIFCDPTAWKDIYGFRTHGGIEMEKWRGFYCPLPERPDDIISAGREEHSQLRRQLAHGFSDRSMREQQPIIMQYVNMLLRRLREGCDAGPLNMTSWYNFTTFDIIGDLAFGESFGCLDSSDYHPWVKMITQTGRAGTIIMAAHYFTPVDRILKALIPSKAMENLKKHEEMSRLKVLKRMSLDYERPDLIEGLLRKKEALGLSIDKIQTNSGLLIIAGSETTATLLAGVTYYLLKNPHALEKLTTEIRSAFKSEDEIDFTSVNSLTYLLACLDEALRSYPPVPLGLPRVVPKGGSTIAGRFVPEGTVVSVFQWATYHLEKNFVDPFGFHPERWLGDPRFAGDQKDALQPFSTGPRNCIGRNLAYVEMRVIIARVIFAFDMKLADDSHDWLSKQKVHAFWEKGPLNVHLTPVAR